MLYDYQYDIGAIIISLTLLSIFIPRMNKNIRSGKLFLTLIIFDFVAAVFDLVSCIMVSYPEKFSLWINYLFLLVYFYSYNMISVLYFTYINEKGANTRLKAVGRIISIAQSTLLKVIIFSSPWTHLVVYFDENMAYYHGPLMILLYVFPFVMVVFEILIFLNSKGKFTKNQLRASIYLIVAISIGLLVTIIFSRVLWGQFILSLSLIFVYIAYEDPAFYSFKDTQCYNKRSFFMWRNQLKAKRKNIRVVAGKIVNYNHLESVNDSETTEQIVKIVADKLYVSNKKKDIYFLRDSIFVIPNDDKKEGDEIANSIKALFDNEIIVNDKEYNINVHICVLDIENDFSDSEVEEIIRYRLSKQEIVHETNRALVDSIINEQKREELLIECIQKAIDNDLFEVYYQPIYNARTKCYESAEALLRLYDEELGYINPEELVIAAEKNGYIDKIGTIIFRKVCKFISENELDKLGLKYIEVNLSPLQCRNIYIAETYLKIMDEYNVPPSFINIEITETADFKNDRQIIENIYKLKSAGMELSIDDYGSGFASPDYLIKMPISLVKIDREIIWNAMKDKQAFIILEDTIRMLKRIDKHIVAEGVETEHMESVLGEINVDYNQGYLYSKPINATDFIDFLKKNM